MIKSLFAYPGNKRDVIPGIDFLESNLFIDPYVGAGSFLLYQFEKNPNAKFIIADKDPAIRAVYQICKYDRKEEVIQSAIALRDKFLVKPDQTWKFIKEVLAYSLDPVQLAYCKLFYQRVAHGSIPRTHSGKKTYNVIWSLDKALGLKTWEPVLPNLSDCDLTIHKDWQECFKSSDLTDTVVFLDPPYYAPGKSSCYPGHKPGAIVTLMTLLAAIQSAIECNPKQLVITHYECSHIDNLLELFNDYSINKTEGNTLDSLNYGKGNYSHGLRSETKTVYNDCIWNLKRK